MTDVTIQQGVPIPIGFLDWARPNAHKAFAAFLWARSMEITHPVNPRSAERAHEQAQKAMIVLGSALLKDERSGDWREDVIMEAAISDMLENLRSDHPDTAYFEMTVGNEAAIDYLERATGLRKPGIDRVDDFHILERYISV